MSWIINVCVGGWLSILFSIDSPVSPAWVNIYRGMLREQGKKKYLLKNPLKNKGKWIFIEEPPKKQGKENIYWGISFFLLFFRTREKRYLLRNLQKNREKRIFIEQPPKEQWKENIYWATPTKEQGKENIYWATPLKNRGKRIFIEEPP